MSFPVRRAAAGVTDDARHEYGSQGSQIWLRTQPAVWRAAQARTSNVTGTKTMNYVQYRGGDQNIQINKEDGVLEMELINNVSRMHTY